MKCYVDTNVFVYSIINPSAKGDAARLFLKQLTTQKHDAYTSVLTISEAHHVLCKNIDKNDALVFTKQLLSTTNIKRIDFNYTILIRAFALLEQYNLKTNDAIHLANMQLHNITYFISEDKDFDKLSFIKRISLSEL